MALIVGGCAVLDPAPVRIKQRVVVRTVVKVVEVPRSAACPTRATCPDCICPPPPEDVWGCRGKYVWQCIGKCRWANGWVRAGKPDIRGICLPKDIADRLNKEPQTR